MTISKLTRNEAIETLWKLYEEESPNYGDLKECIISLQFYYDDYADDYDYDYDYYYYYCDYYYYYDADADDDYLHTIICLILAAEGEL